jgi:hypothetical protein
MVVFFWRATGISPLELIVPRREDWRMYRALWARLTGRA